MHRSLLQKSRRQEYHREPQVYPGEKRDVIPRKQEESGHEEF